jgi:hypothetical protein
LNSLYLNERIYLATASAVVRLSRDRTSEMIMMNMSNSLLARIILELPLSVIRTFSDEVFMKLFGSPVERVRKISVLRCVQALSKRRIMILSDKQMRSSSTRYYNVNYWIDFGLSTEKNTVNKTLRRLVEVELRNKHI